MTQKGLLFFSALVYTISALITWGLPVLSYRLGFNDSGTVNYLGWFVFFPTGLIAIFGQIAGFAAFILAYFWKK